MNEHRIPLGSRNSTILRFGFILQGVLLLLGVIVFAIAAMHIFSGNTLVLALLSLIAATLFFLLARQYFNNVFFKEWIAVSGSQVKIINKNLTDYREKVFEANDIKFLGYAGRLKYTEHPMHNDVLDITGLATVEKELQYLIDEGTLEIETATEVFRFGKNMTSWDAEEAITQLESYLHKKFPNKYKTKEDVDLGGG